MRETEREREPLLGVLGGMGPEATQIFYRHLIRRTKAERDQEHIRVLIFGDSTVPDRTAAILSGEEEAARARLVADARVLEKAGCTCLAMTCNTAHHFAPDIQRATSIPLLHMPRLTVERAKALGIGKLALLGTEGCMKAGVYQEICTREGVDCWTPDEATQTLVTKLIYGQIKAGQRGDETLFARIDAAVKNAGCGGAVLGCTELSVYRAFHPLDGFYLDALEVLVERCVTACGGTLRPEEAV